MTPAKNSGQGWNKEMPEVSRNQCPRLRILAFHAEGGIPLLTPRPPFKASFGN